ncbi:MAG: hypothetical protein EHM45_05135 [Desulfobacteraceae bacterium]|nr:MAG: hypothetical protein EHM45_05135 [Desulfobacteraceae bacterium]
MVNHIDPAQSEERSCSDDYVHDCHQVPFSKPEDTKSFFFWLFVVLGVPVLIIALIIYALFRWVF